MTIVADLTNTNYNYIISRGGEAGCVTASRLAEALPDCKIPMIGARPSDLDNKSILDLRSMDNLMGGEFDYGFKSTEQPNVLTNAWIYRIDVIDGFTTGMNVTLQLSRKLSINAKKETIFDLPGVGENLQNHPEVIITWEMHEPLEDKTVLWADVALLASREPSNIHGDDGTVPGAMMHIYTIPFDVHQAALGYELPKNVFFLTPHVPRFRSCGKTSLNSADPKEHHAINFGYLTDPDGYDGRHCP
ncbi:hypothetical protein BKA60DRAFT_545359 [Fusarium oxysporum]|nr:hypothetical protein BKA60DRAFT_545359 [Fusarium oxysporum]